MTKIEKKKRYTNIKAKINRPRRRITPSFEKLEIYNFIWIYLANFSHGCTLMYSITYDLDLSTNSNKI